MKDIPPKANHYIESLGLIPHPEGGWYKETYRSEGSLSAGTLKQFEGDRSFSTAIYFMLTEENFSAFHRIKSDEMWHFYDGDGLIIHELMKDGMYQEHRLGLNMHRSETPQLVIKANSWFASEVITGGAWCLVGCTVSPGFDFSDFELGKSEELIHFYSDHKKLISRLTRNGL